MYPRNTEKYKINHLALKMARDNNLSIGEVKSKLATELGVTYRHLNRIASADRPVLSHQQMEILKQFFKLPYYEKLENKAGFENS